MTLDTINLRYPEDNWVRIYTDGSKMEKHSNIGAGVYSNLFSFYIPVGHDLSAFDGEVGAIRVALNKLTLHQDKFTNVVILSDSKAAIQTISRTSSPCSPDILNTVKLLKQNGKTVVFQWIPGHCGIHGNEQADTLPKKVARLLLPIQKPVPYYSIKKYVKQLFKEESARELNARIFQKQWKTSILDTPCGPRKNAEAIFCLTTGHDILAKHLHHLGIMQSPVCVLCNLEDMDRCHAQPFTVPMKPTTTGKQDRRWPFFNFFTFLCCLC